jgi:hypothetical protein
MEGFLAKADPADTPDDSLLDTRLLCVYVSDGIRGWPFTCLA